jgi:hypothetical protein
VSLLADGLFLPALLLAFLAWLVPKLLSMLLPEGVRPLMINAFLSTLILFGLSTVFFSLLYIWKGVGWDELASFGTFANIVFFGKLGLISGMIWAPIMVLSVASLPRNWVKAIW